MSDKNNTTSWSFGGSYEPPKYDGDSGSNNWTVNTPSVCGDKGCIGGTGSVTTSPGSSGLPVGQSASIGLSFKF